MASLFDLPPETRNSIYGLLLPNSSSNLTTLTASRLLHEEAVSYFYQNTSIDVGIDLVNAATTDATVLPSIPDKYLTDSRILAVSVRLRNLGRVREQAQRLAAIADHCASVTTLTLSITSAGSRVVSSMLDDYVLHASHPLILATRPFLLCSTIRSVRVNLDRVWFAPGTLDQLTSDGRLEIFTSETSIERPMYGYQTHDHLRELGIEGQEIEDAENLQRGDLSGTLPCVPASLESALSELDHFSPTEELDNWHEHLYNSAADKRSEPSSDGLMFDMDDIGEAYEEELTEDDDVDDDDMEKIDDIEGIVDNLVQVYQQKVNSKDICYMANFAPHMLRLWCESLP